MGYTPGKSSLLCCSRLFLGADSIRSLKSDFVSSLNFGDPCDTFTGVS